MSLIQKLSSIANRFLPTNLKTLYKAGLVDGNMEITPLGLKELEAIILEQNMEELVKVAEKLIEKKAKKK